MKKNSCAKGSLVLALVMVLSSAAAAFAAPAKDNFPNKPIVNIVSWAAGGTTDIGQRLVASILPKYLGQTMVIENQAGGAAVPGTTAIAKAKADGYTIGVNWNASFTLRPAILKVPYKADDYVFIIGMLNQWNVLAVRADSPFKTLDDLIKYAKANPGKLNYSGGGGSASYQQMLAAVLAKQAKFEAEMVSYDGSRPAVIALLGGNLDFVVAEPGNMMGEIKSGQVRVLCNFENRRLEILPDVPSLKELGYDVYFPQSQIIIGPKGIPADRVKILHDAFKKTFEDPEFLRLAKNAGLEIQYKSGEEVKKDIEDTIKKLTPILKEIFPQKS